MNDYLFSIAQCASKESVQYSGYKFYAFYIPKLLYVDAFAIFLDIRIHERKRNKRKPWNSREKLGRENLIRNTLEIMFLVVK